MYKRQSETKAEIDRFITALLAIRAEIKAIENAEISAEDSPCLLYTSHAAKAIAIVASDLLALTILKEPGAMGADIAV